MQNENPKYYSLENNSDYRFNYLIYLSIKILNFFISIKYNMAKENENYLRTIIIIAVVIGLGYLAYTLYNQNVLNNMNDSEDNIKENYQMMEGEDVPQMNTMGEMNTMDEMNRTGEVENFTNSGDNSENNMDYLSMDENFKNERTNSNFPKEQLNADDLLPKDDSSLWAKVNPAGEGSLKDKNFLQSGYHIGINTVGQTLRNANQQLRSEPANPQVKVSPWLQTTIEPDMGRKPMEIGGCA